MRAYRHTSFTWIDALDLVEEEIPPAGAGQVLVRVRASSLNFRDPIIANGEFPFPGAPGFIALSDGAGEIEAIGDGVTRLAVGDRVVNSFLPTWFGGKLREVGQQYVLNLDGWLAEYRVVSEQALVAMPAHLTFEEAATLPCTAVTAWTALDGVASGDTVLTQGSGSVSLFALQLAQILGARVIATTSTNEKAQRLGERGAAAVINYVQNPAWSTEVRDLTGGRGVDRVVEVGGSGTIAQSIKSVTSGGEIALVGMLDPTPEGMNLIDFFLSQATLRAIVIGSREDLEEMNRGLTVHDIHPVIDRVFPFEQARQASTHFADGNHFGKVVISH